VGFFVYQELKDFVKMTLTRVSSHWLWIESSLVILFKTWLVSSRVTKNCDSSRV